MLMSNLEVMKEKFVKAHRDMVRKVDTPKVEVSSTRRQADASVVHNQHADTQPLSSPLVGATQSNQCGAATIGHSQTSPAANDLFGVVVSRETPALGRVELPQQKHVSSTTDDASSSMEVPPAVAVEQHINAHLEQHQVELQKMLNENTQLRQQIDTLQKEIVSQTDAHVGENLKSTQQRTRFDSEIDALRKENETLRRQIEESTTSKQAQSTQEQDALNTMQQSLDEANQKIAQLEGQLKQLNEEYASREGHLRKQLEEQGDHHEHQIRIHEKKDIRQQEQIQQMERKLDLGNDTKLSHILDSSPAQPHEPLSETSAVPPAATAQLKHTVEYFAEENANLMDLVRSYESLLETLSQKVSLTHQNLKCIHSNKVTDLERHIKRLEDDLCETRQENLVLDARLNIALETLKQAYLARCDELATQDQEMPTLIEENQILRELVTKRHVEILGK